MPIPDINDHSGECKALLDPEIGRLEDFAVLHGYTIDEVEFAMLAVVLARMKMREATIDADDAIKRALKSIGED